MHAISCFATHNLYWNKIRNIRSSLALGSQPTWKSHSYFPGISKIMFGYCGTTVLVQLDLSWFVIHCIIFVLSSPDMKKSDNSFLASSPFILCCASLRVVWGSGSSSCIHGNTLSSTTITCDFSSHMLCSMMDALSTAITFLIDTWRWAVT